ncbi:Acyltransferase LovD [Cytospora mali]|uniref:Acyltransferase LovD n=1 Tax=Cytospora mali TaxID=578113 RepID=A0A194V9V6_CYTMA|nr:Acyltransferase LovD [Valsa mali var. pyri (nom. inval.)]
MAPLSFETQISEALAEHIHPGVVLRAKSKDGRLDYTKAIGPWDTKTIFPMMSMTKLLTSIAAAQAIEQGLIALETDITPYLPTLAAQPILTGFDPDDGKPILKQRTSAITFRHLLTHSYGQTYPIMDARVTGRYVRQFGAGEVVAIDGTRSVEETFDVPLLCEPGEAWIYGPGLDWAGLVIEKVSGVTLEEFMAAHIFAPLGIKDMSFFPARHPGMVERIAELSARDEGTGRAVPAPPEMIIVDPAQVKYCQGGGGLFASIDDYLKVVESLLMDDEKLLKKKTAEELLFQQQLHIKREMKLHPWVVGWTPEPTEGYTWSLAGLLTPAGKGHRGKGFLQWGGMYNSSWFIDREAGLTGLFGTCLMPSADAQIEELMKIYELGLYEQLTV